MDLCGFFGVSRQAYYKGLRRSLHKDEQHEQVITLVQQIRCRHKQMGGKKLYTLLQGKIHEVDEAMGRDKFFVLLRERGLLVRRRRKYVTTTRSRHRFHIHPNRLNGLKVDRPHQVWVSDITYVRVRTGFVYLFLITDAHSRKIVGWSLHESLGLKGALQALKMAIRQCPAPSGLIHHSDRGFQYCSHAYVKMLNDRGIQISMAEAGNCYENALAERVNGILKEEYGLDEVLGAESQARLTAREAIWLYNQQRPHWSLNLKVPAEVHQAA